MSVMKRVSMIFKAKANKALDRMEDPRETLDYSYQRQLEMLTQVRRDPARLRGATDASLQLIRAAAKRDADGPSRAA